MWFTAKKGGKYGLKADCSDPDPSHPLSFSNQGPDSLQQGLDKCVLTIHLFFVDAAHNSRLQRWQIKQFMSRSTITLR